jgi:hypothetical protein
VQHLRFDDLGVWEGRCTPEQEPFPTAAPVLLPTWLNLQSKFTKPTVLTAALKFDDTSLGSACGNVYLRSYAGGTCKGFSLEVNVRPTWGKISVIPNTVAKGRTDATAGALRWRASVHPLELLWPRVPAQSAAATVCLHCSAAVP